MRRFLLGSLGDAQKQVYSRVCFISNTTQMQVRQATHTMVSAAEWIPIPLDCWMFRLAPSGATMDGNRGVGETERS